MAAESTLLTTADGVPLKVSLRRVERKRKIKAAALVSPLFLFVMISFVIPILLLLYRAVDSPEVSQVMPRTTEAVRQWDGSGLPGEVVFEALVTDLRQARKERTIGKAAKRLNNDITGFRSVIMKTGRKLGRLKEPIGSYRDALVQMDKRWGERKYWAAIKRAAAPYTDFYMLSAVDLMRDASGEIVGVPENRALYVGVLGRTLWMSLLVTVSCLILGYPVAWLLATLPMRTSNMLMILVLLPFWTSLLVRTCAWMLVLQKEGVVNDVLVWLHLVPEPVQLVFNRFGVIISMTHILLPFMILPLYSVMKGIPPDFMRAAISLGANPAEAFYKVYVPQTMPGIGAGCLLVFILAIGYYITPALLGSPTDQMLSYFIAFFTNNTINWGMASALAVILLTATMILYVVYSRLIGFDRMKLG
jgi:putative spermidine/putrescine transport system permease protein